MSRDGQWSDPELPAVTRVCDHFARRILTGRDAPGARLPSTRAGALDLGVHHMTLAEAYRRLEQRGLVTIRERVGAFVAERVLPATGVVVAGAPMIPGSAFTTATYEILHRLSAEGLPGEVKLVAREANQLPFLLRWLKERAQRRELRGVWLGNMNPDWVAAAHGLLEQFAVPTVVLTPRRILPRTVDIDLLGAVRAATRHLVERGRRRLAFLAQYLHVTPDIEEAFRASCEALGVEYRIESFPFRADDVSSTFERFGERTLRKLLGSSRPPDGVLIADDFIGRGAFPVLLRSGLRVGEDLDVCTHCRKGDAFPEVFGLPVARLVSDSRELADAAFDMMERIVAGEELAEPHVRVPLRLEPAEAFAEATVFSSENNVPC